MEAMRAGVPVVVSDAVPSVVERGLLATQAPPGSEPPAIVCSALDIDAIALGLTRLAVSEADRATFIARGHAHVADKTWESVAIRHGEIWQQL
jgi:glycosyltransferase involved in cell wall biosynthesis